MGHLLLIKKDKENTYREPQNEASKDKNKAKSNNSSTTANQPQTPAPEKDKRGHWGGHPAIEINVTKVAKKKMPKDLSHIKCYTYYKVTMPLSIQTSQKTCGGLDDLHVNFWQENGGKTTAGILHLVSHYFEGPDRGPARLTNQN